MIYLTTAVSIIAAMVVLLAIKIMDVKPPSGGEYMLVAHSEEVTLWRCSVNYPYIYLSGYIEEQDVYKVVIDARTKKMIPFMTAGDIVYAGVTLSENTIKVSLDNGTIHSLTFKKQ